MRRGGFFFCFLRLLWFAAVADFWVRVRFVFVAGVCGVVIGVGWGVGLGAGLGAGLDAGWGAGWGAG